MRTTALGFIWDNNLLIAALGHFFLTPYLDTFKFLRKCFIVAENNETDDTEVKEEAEKEEAKPEVKKASSKKEVEEEDDKREHVNIIFIGHVGKSFVFSITLLFLWNMNIIIRNGSKLSLSFFFQMLENQQLVVMLCKLQCMCCVKTFVFGIFFPIFPAVGAPPLDLGVSYKFHATVLCQHCVKNKIRNVNLLCHIYLITALNNLIQCPVTASVNKDFMVICFLPSIWQVFHFCV